MKKEGKKKSKTGGKEGKKKRVLGGKSGVC